MSLSVENAWKTFVHKGTAQTVLRDVSMEVQPGELVGDRHFQAELDIVAQAVGIALLAQLGAHPRHQFVLVHRPGEIVVDAHFQRLGQLAAVAIGYHHQDRHMAAFGQ